MAGTQTHNRCVLSDVSAHPTRFARALPFSNLQNSGRVARLARRDQIEVRSNAQFWRERADKTTGTQIVRHEEQAGESKALPGRRCLDRERGLVEPDVLARGGDPCGKGNIQKLGPEIMGIM